MTSWPVHSVHDCTSDGHTVQSLGIFVVHLSSLYSHTPVSTAVCNTTVGWRAASAPGCPVPGAAAHAASLFITIGAKARWSLATSLRECDWIVAYRHPVGVAMRHVDDPHLTVADEGDHRLRHHRVGEGRRHWW